MHAGADGVLGTADDVHHARSRTSTTPFVDQNQTYTSHPSHQVFLREYAFNGAGDPVATGRLITNRNLGDGIFGNATTSTRRHGHLGRRQGAGARLLGIALTDTDVAQPAAAGDRRLRQVHPRTGDRLRADRAAPDRSASLDPDGNGLASGTPGAPIDASLAVRTGHAFLDDIAHDASPVNSQTGAPLDGRRRRRDRHTSEAAAPTTTNCSTPTTSPATAAVNENIGLTAVHHVFHAEHNRLVEHTKDVILASNDPTSSPSGSSSRLDGSMWNGERLFQAARFGTEMQYQHLVFEEFARKVQPQVDIFFAATQVYDTEIDPSIVAEFAHTVYRFGHSMLTETVDRFDAEFNVVGDPDAGRPGASSSG